MGLKRRCKKHGKYHIKTHRNERDPVLQRGNQSICECCYGDDEFIGKRLNEYKGKQIGVPFNISIGGGSQGLLESMTFDGQDSEDLGLLIEQNFAGSFIGQISEFKFNICDLNWVDISSGCVIPCET